MSVAISSPKSWIIYLVISSTNLLLPNDTIYSLNGRVMDHCSLMPRGIYIQNGKKIIYRRRGLDNRL